MPPFTGSPIVAALNRAAETRAARHHPTPLCPSGQNGISSHDTAMACDSVDMPQTPSARRAVQNVLTISQRIMVCKWMALTVMSCPHGPKNISSKAVKHFPDMFRGSENANLHKASRIWHDISKYMKLDSKKSNEAERACLTISRNTPFGMKRISMKAIRGRGRKLLLWKKHLFADWRDEFDRLRKLGVKFNLRNLSALGKHVINTSENVHYSSFMIDACSGKPVIDMVTPRFVQSFADTFRIRSRAHRGKKKLSPAKELQIERDVARHLGILCRILRNKVVDENDIENADETHFMIDMDNGTTLGFAGDVEVKYADVVSGGEGMTMLVRLSGGRDARIEPVFMIFKNKDRHYPIRGTPDDVLGISYRSGPKGWIDTTVLPEYFRERKVFSKLPNGRQRVLFLDNCSGHNETSQLCAALNSVNTTLRFSPQTVPTWCNRATRL